jgi:hypothetical protein
MDSLMNAGRRKIFLDPTKWIGFILKVIPIQLFFGTFPFCHPLFDIICKVCKNLIKQQNSA